MVQLGLWLVKQISTTGRDGLSEGAEILANALPLGTELVGVRYTVDGDFANRPELSALPRVEI
jgi:6-phosphofructokinase